MKNTVTKIKNTLKDSITDYTEKWIRKLEDRVKKITQTEQKKNEKLFLKMRTLGQHQAYNIHLRGVPEGEKK